MTVTSLIPTPPIPPPTPADENPFRYGWRFVRHTGPDGQETWEQVPLTLEDVLHPQEGDHISENDVHEQECRYLADIFNRRLRRAAGHRVFRDCLVNWGVAGIRNHSPDISVFSGIVRPQAEPIGIFDLVASGGRCRMALEIVSPDTRSNDVERKFDEYYRAGVPLYVIVDQERESSPRQLRGYQVGPNGYEEIPLDAQGRLPLPFLGLSLGLRDNRLVGFDLPTGAEIGDYDQVDEARQAAETQARQADEARQAAETRLQELEAELRRLRGQGPPASTSGA